MACIVNETSCLLCSWGTLVEHHEDVATLFGLPCSEVITDKERGVLPEDH